MSWALLADVFLNPRCDFLKRLSAVVHVAELDLIAKVEADCRRKGKSAAAFAPLAAKKVNVAMIELSLKALSKGKVAKHAKATEAAVTLQNP